MRGQSFFAANHLALLIASAALSAPASANKLSLDCDTAPNAYSKLLLEDGSPSGGIKASVTPIRIRTGDGWATSMGATILSPENGSSIALTLSQYRLSAGGPLSQDFRAQVKLKQGEKISSHWIGNTIKLNETVEFEVTVDDQGNGKVKFGDSESNFETGLGKNRNYFIGCSTGQYQFTDISFLQ